MRRKIAGFVVLAALAAVLQFAWLARLARPHLPGHVRTFGIGHVLDRTAAGGLTERLATALADVVASESGLRQAPAAEADVVLRAEVDDLVTPVGQASGAAVGRGLALRVDLVDRRSAEALLRTGSTARSVGSPGEDPGATDEVLRRLARRALGPKLQRWPLRWLTIFAFVLSAHLFYLYNLVFHIWAKPPRVRAAYVGWYVAMFLLFVVVASGPPGTRLVFGGLHRLLLFGLFLMLTSAFFHMPALFGFLAVALVSYLVVPFFAEATLVLLTILYLVFLVELRWARLSRNYLVLACFVLGFVLLLVVLFPLVNLGVMRSPQDLRTASLGASGAAAETRQAIWMSLQTATVATLLVLALGVPLAYFLVRSDFRGRNVLDALVDLPIVLPPPVVGLALVQLVGPNQDMGAALRDHFGIVLANDWKGIVLAQAFVSSPFLVRSAMAAFRAVDPRLENVSRTLGASPLRTFFRVTLPLAARGIFMGCILTWGRAIGEFGSVTFIAEHPETMPVRIYKQFVESGEKGPSITLAILMIVLCVLVFAGLHLLASRTLWRNVSTLWSRAGDPSRRPE